MNSEMKNNHQPTQYTMKDLFAALDPMSSLVSLHQSKQEKEEEFKETKADRAAMGGMNSSSTSTASHHTMEDLFEALDPMSLFNLSRIQSFTLEPEHRYKAYAELRDKFKLQMKLQPQQQKVQPLKQQQQEEEFNTVTNFTLERGPRYKAYTELRERRLQMKHQPLKLQHQQRFPIKVESTRTPLSPSIQSF